MTRPKKKAERTKIRDTNRRVNPVDAEAIAQLVPKYDGGIDGATLEAAREQYQAIARSLPQPEDWSQAKVREQTFGAILANMQAAVVLQGTAAQFIPRERVAAYLKTVTDRTLAILNDAARLVSTIEGLTQEQREAFRTAHRAWINECAAKLKESAPV